MSQTKAQLIQPIGVVTASGVVVSGVMTAATFDGDIVGSATSIIQGTNLSLGAFNATSFAGDFTGNATGIITSSAIKVGQLTASSFVGDFTGTATSMARGTGFEAGTVTSTAANVTYTVTVGSKTGGGNAFYLDGVEAPNPTLYPGATYTFDQSAGTNATHPLRFATAADAAGSTEYTDGVTTNGTPGSAGAWTKIVVPRNAPTPLYYYCTNHSGMGDSISITNKLQGAVTGDVTGSATGIAGTVVQGTNIHVGVVTATSLYGDGSNLTGIAATNFNTQTVAAVGSATTIDLSAGNIITFNQNTDTTVSFANTSEAMDITLIRPGGERNVAISYASGGVEFDGSDWLSIPDDSDFTFGTDDFTIECWYKTNNITGLSDSFDYIFAAGWPIQLAHHNSSYKRITFWMKDTAGSGGSYVINDLNTGTGSITSTTKWYHIAVTRNGSTFRIFLDGVLKNTQTSSVSAPAPGEASSIGRFSPASPYYYANGTVSNFRYVKGTALYTSNFLPPTEALTNITNTKLLCCQSTSSTTAATVIPTGSITAGGDPTAAAETIALASASYLTQGTITWPSGVRWNGGGAVPRTGLANEDEVDQFQMLTRDSGVTWYAWEPMDIDYKFKYEAYTFGDDESGMLGQNTDNIKKSSPTQIGGSWIDAAASGRTWLLSKPGGSLWANGFGTSGQLAQNDAVTRSSPIQIGRDTNWSLYNKGGSGTSCLATKTDGSLWIWGYNDSGVLGQNQAEAQLNSLSSPIQIPGTYRTTRGGIADTRANNNAVVGADGTLWTWGQNEFGELGLNNKTNYSSPCQVPGTTWASVFGGQDSMYALKTNGSAWAWGRNNSGMLGLSNTTNYSSPVQLPGTWFRIGKVGSVAAGIKFSWAGAKIGTGSLWTWGLNSYGQLGHNNKTNYSSPKQVGSEETWNLVQGSWASAIATKTDGTLWAWGLNNDSTGAGNLGQNNITNYSSPVQIPGTDWKYAYGSYGAMWAFKGDNRAWTPRPLVNQSPMGLDLP